MVCHTCKRRANLRAWRRGLERWVYEMIGRRKVWTCWECLTRQELMEAAGDE